MTESTPTGSTQRERVDVMPTRRAILLMGPTGAGKTDLTLELARRYPVEIVSVDSAMVYRGLNIGTGKPDEPTLRLIPHHLIDILDPSEPYSAGQFVRDARRLIDAIHARGRTPLLSGGTSLYFRSLTQGLAAMPAAAPDVRAQLEAEAALKGWPSLHQELALIDPRAAQRIQPNDAQRIQRALEVYRLTGRTLSELHAATPAPDSSVQFHKLVWNPAQREVLYERIERRFESMLEQGLLEEIRRLHTRGDLRPDLPALRSVGYRQLWAHLDGHSSLAEASRQAVVATRHLARRQLIWLRGDPTLQWFDSADSAAMNEVLAAVEKVIAGDGTVGRAAGV